MRASNRSVRINKGVCVDGFPVVWYTMAANPGNTDFRAMIENAPEAVIVFNYEAFLYLNPFAADRLGMDPASLVGKSIMDFVHPDSRPLVVSRLRQLAATGVAGPPMEVRFVSKSGTEIPAEIVSMPTMFDGKPAILGYIRDISKRLEAERELRESEERFANAFRYSPHGMAFVSVEGRWLRANESLCQMLGYSEDELRETNIQGVTHPDDFAEDQAQLRRLVLGETSAYNRVKRYYRKDGELIWVSLAVSAVHDAAGKVIYCVGQIQDITAQRQLEQSSLQAERLAGIAEATVAIAHEMNNVLTALTMNAELLAQGASPEETLEIVAEILTASNRIATTVRRLRNVADLKSVEYLGDKKMLDLSPTTPKKQRAG